MNKNKKNKSARRIKGALVRVTRARNKPLAWNLAPYCAQSCADREHTVFGTFGEKNRRSRRRGWVARSRPATASSRKFIDPGNVSRETL